MRHLLACLCVLGSVSVALDRCSVPASEFHLDGEYLIGGLFNIHYAGAPVHSDRPEAVDCSSQPFLLSHYRRFQSMRFSIAEINNSTNLLPNVSLGYEIFNHCSDAQSFPDIFNFLSLDGLIQTRDKAHRQPQFSSVIAVVGPSPSTHTLTLAPLLMVDLIPMVNYGSSASVFSQKSKFPSFVRTVHPSKRVIDAIVRILKHFNWRWVAFLNDDDDFGIDGLELFMKIIAGTNICLAYTNNLNHDPDYESIFRQIEVQDVHVIIVFAIEKTAEAMMKAAIKLNIRSKVWIAGDSWSLNKVIPKEEGVQDIGTVVGVAQPLVTMPGFSDFIYSTKGLDPCEAKEQINKTTEPEMFCNQVCNCSDVNPQELIDSDPSFSFSVYSAVYAVAHALHNTLRCGADGCDTNMTVQPYMVLAELKKSNFTLLNQSIQFDENGDPVIGSYSVVFWNHQGEAEEVGFYRFQPFVNFYINNSKIQWYGTGEVPTSLCSPECLLGFAKKKHGIHKCCFTCTRCPNGTYNNITEDPYTCVPCQETEWAPAGSTSCRLRLVEYIPFTDAGALLIMAGACAFVLLTLSMSVLFALNYHTPVVRSAGGPMCFLILGSLSLSSVSIFFHFDKPTQAFCILRFLPFVLFYTVCLACFVVRSFQIVCIFKIAAKIPKLQSWWVKYHGQWLVIVVPFIIHVFIIVITYAGDPPRPYNDTDWAQDRTILSCQMNISQTYGSVCVLFSLCAFCFIFSYMGKDLPKNYNEAKAITFCLLLVILTWIIFATVSGMYRGKFIQILNATAVLSSLYSFLLWYFLPKCYIIIFQPQKNTKQHFQGIIQNYTMTMNQ